MHDLVTYNSFKQNIQRYCYCSSPSFKTYRLTCRSVVCRYTACMCLFPICSKWKYWRWCSWPTSGSWSIPGTRHSCNLYWRDLQSGFSCHSLLIGRKICNASYCVQCQPMSCSVSKWHHAVWAYTMCIECSYSLLRFAHLISVDFFSDLMSVLHSLAETGVGCCYMHCGLLLVISVPCAWHINKYIN